MPVPGEGATQAPPPQHCLVPSPNPRGAETHLLDVVAVLFLGHGNILVNCRGRWGRVVGEWLQPLTQASPDRHAGQPEPQAGAEPTAQPLAHF